MIDPPTAATEPGTDTPAGDPQKSYVLRLYVTGTTARSARAITNMRRICEEHLNGRYELEVIDLYQHPSAAKENQIIAAPTLVRLLPAPLRRIIGDLSDRERVLIGLEIQSQPAKFGED
jgi:circadian clock protein KaiB